MPLLFLSVLWVYLIGCLTTQSNAYPAMSWSAPREYEEDDYYYNPNMQYYYNAPARRMPEVYGRIPYPYYYDPYSYIEEDPIRQDERLANLPIGQETWYESETEPSWRSNNLNDINTAFLDDLILTQMAQDAQRRREISRNTMPAQRDVEDEDVRELKALAGKPLYHSPKTAPRFEEDDYEDNGFINWDGGNKRSVTTPKPLPKTSEKPKAGQDEIMVPRPADPHGLRQSPEEDNVYEKITKILAAEAKLEQEKKAVKPRRLDKRFIAEDSDLVAELRGLKQRIRT